MWVGVVLVLLVVLLLAMLLGLAALLKGGGVASLQALFVEMPLLLMTQW
jgi:hypothetical protein